MIIFLICLWLVVGCVVGTNTPHFNKQAKIIKDGRRYSIQKRMLYGNFKEFDYTYDCQSTAEAKALAYMAPKLGPQVIAHLK